MAKAIAKFENETALMGEARSRLGRKERCLRLSKPMRFEIWGWERRDRLTTAGNGLSLN